MLHFHITSYIQHNIGSISHQGVSILLCLPKIIGFTHACGLLRIRPLLIHSGWAYGVEKEALGLGITADQS